MNFLAARLVNGIREKNMAALTERLKEKKKGTEGKRDHLTEEKERSWRLE